MAEAPAPAATAAGPSQAMRDRSRGRACAVRLLYAWEANRFLGEAGDLLTGEERDEAGAGYAFANELFAGVRNQRTAVDAAIDGRLENWTIQRLAVTDRAILRLGAYEILYRDDTPPKVAISEAVDLAKIFGSEDKSPRLVNGVLDRIAREHRPGELAKRGPPTR